jgi:hypothetical protein
VVLHLLYMYMRSERCGEARRHRADFTTPHLASRPGNSRDARVPSPSASASSTRPQSAVHDSAHTSTSPTEHSQQRGQAAVGKSNHAASPLRMNTVAAVYFEHANSFAEVDAFVCEVEQVYKVCVLRTGEESLRDSLENALTQRPLKAMFLGTRRTDPHGGWLSVCCRVNCGGLRVCLCVCVSGSAFLCSLLFTLCSGLCVRTYVCVYVLCVDACLCVCDCVHVCLRVGVLLLFSAVCMHSHAGGVHRYGWGLASSDASESDSGLELRGRLGVLAYFSRSLLPAIQRWVCVCVCVLHAVHTMN